MFALYLLLALMTSYSLYAADTDEASTALIVDTAQIIPETVPLPEGLIAIASSEEDPPKANGCFFTESHTVLLTVLRLANPRKDDSRENNRRLEKVQALLEEGVTRNLSHPYCSGCVKGKKEVVRSNGPPYYICSDCRRDCHYNLQAKERKKFIKAVVEHCNNSLREELSETVLPEAFMQSLAAYKVIGFLYFLTDKVWIQQTLVPQLKAKDGPSTGKLPCELGCLVNDEDRYILTSQPELNSSERSDFIFNSSPQNEIGTIAYNAKTALSYILSDKLNTEGAYVVVIDRHRLFSLRNEYTPTYTQQPKKEEEKKGCCILS